MPSLVATLGANITPFIQGMESAKGKAADAGSNIASSLGGKVGVALAGIATVAGVKSAMEHAIEYGSHIQDLSERLGISTDAVQVWDYALKQTGKTVDSAVGFFEKMAVARNKAFAGDDKAIESFHRLGISIEDLKGKRIEDIGAQISKAFQSGDPQQLIGSLRDVGGKGAGDMVAAFRLGFAEMSDEAHKFGQVLDQTTVEKLDEAGDRLTQIKTALMVNLAAPFTEFILGGIDGVQKLGSAIGIYIAVPMGRVFESLGKFDFKHPIDSFKNMVLNAFEGISDAREGYAIKLGEKEAAEADKRARAKAGMKVSGFDDGAENKKQAAADKALATLERQVEEERRRGAIASMTDAQKVAALREQITLLDQQAASEEDPVRRGQLMLEMQKRINEEQAADRTLKLNDLRDSERADKLSRPVAQKNMVNSLQQMGGFLGNYVQAPEVAMLDVQKKSEGHLSKVASDMAAVRKGIEKMNGSKVASVGGGVEF